MKKSKSSVAPSKSDFGEKPAPDEFLVVGIGASAGGIQALKAFFENVTADSGMAYVVILHLSPDHDSKLAEILQTVSPILVKQVTKKTLIQPNHVYVVPPNKSLIVSDGQIEISPIKTVEERRAPVDIFFRTLAETHHARAIAVVLSGTGANGSMGIKRVKERGGVAFVQNPREAEFGEMPSNSIATELIDAVLNVREIPKRILAYKNSLGTVEIPIEPEMRPEDQQHSLREIFTLIRVRTGHDFSNYKRATVLRRIERRINVHSLQDLPTYAAYLRDTPEEAQALLKDLLISVTNFYRDKEVFDYLEKNIIPKILKGKTAADQLRIWVAGCATGEEAYSLAMLFAEHLKGSTNAPTLQIFATDIDQQALTNAREGLYTLNDAADVSPERLQRFFIRENKGFRVRRELRESILFANHNVIKDPPFSHLDLATCRNMLIYLNQTAQERVMETMHFALNPGGYLFLGLSESIEGAGDLYAPVNKHFHIYQSRRASGRTSYPVPEVSPSLMYTEKSPPSAETKVPTALERISYGDLHQQLLEQYAPPSIVVNEEYDIVHLSERAGRFLQVAGGEPTKNLLKMVRPELRIELRTALYQAVQRQTNLETKNLAVRVEDHAEIVNIHIRPVLRESSDTARGFILVIFETVGTATGLPEEILTEPEPLARQLEEELVRIKTQLRLSVEQFEVQTEELLASNEELQALNEELRSAAEELETSREELQAVNEELITVNQELKIKIEELSQSNNDFQNLMSSTDIGTIFLDRDLCVKMFTPRVREIFNLIDADLHRPLSDITGRVSFEDLQTVVEGVITNLQAVESEVETDAGKWYLMRVYPYRTVEDRIGGVVITFVDITNRKRSEFQMAELNRQISRQSQTFDKTLSSITDFAYIFDLEGQFIYANQPLLDLLGLSLDEIKGKTFFELPYPKELAEHLHNLIQQVIETKQIVVDETQFTSPTGENGFYEYIFSPVIAADDTVEVVSGSTRNTTDRRRAEETLRESEERFRIMANYAPVKIWLSGLDKGCFWFNKRWLEFTGRTMEQEYGFGWMQGIHPDDLTHFHNIHDTNFDRREPFHLEYRMRRYDGEYRWLLKYGVPRFESSGEFVGYIGSCIDITERKRAETSLIESEERLRLILESVSDYAIFTITHERLINSWNTGAEKIFGYRESEIIGKKAAILFTPEDRAGGIPENEIQTAAAIGRAEDERWHIRKDNTRFYASGVMSKLKQDGGFVKIARDMTDKLLTDKTLHEKDILQQIVGAQEDERRRIARDLHDQLGQQLTGLKLKLETISHADDAIQLADKIREMQEIAASIGESVDFLAWELRPAALDDLGLLAALEVYVREWSRISKIKAEFYSSGLKNTRLAPTSETNLYRVAQEALNNVLKHSKASKVSVLLERRNDSVILIIEDDGTGFDPEDKIVKSGGIGLTGMIERAALIGGTLHIESNIEQGTTIYVRIPVNID